ncbi:PREDICTED: vitellogenin-like [Eufriesea mexicana]|uniref:vitellogenin-like n=1 Tax=Eufriesea mexicana TaxID=516756 RepID=UPI00083BA9C9|nr:PREDICTED: vitellogenin-like [Eufriesea mexicana]
MLVIILPFLLAAHVHNAYDVVHRSGLGRYVPECTYDVLVNMSLANIVHERDNFCSMVATELKCRPQGSDILSCRFAESRVVRPSPDDSRCTNARNFVPVLNRFVNEDPFEIRFNSRGIENLVVSRDIPRWRLDMIRAIVGQLNVGFELENAHDRFVTMENSNIGYCEVEVKVSRAGYGWEGERPRHDQFDIVFNPERPGIAPLDSASLRIDKVRQPKNCPNRKIYFFGNQEDFSFGNKNTYMDMTTSISHMYVSNKELYSFTETTGVMRTLNKPRTMRLHQQISLSLRSIDHARDPFPEIMNPASTSLYAYTNLDRIPEYK